MKLTNNINAYFTLICHRENYAPIVDSMICSQCGKSVMESHVRLRESKPYCLSCCATGYLMVAGKGIHTGK